MPAIPWKRFADPDPQQEYLVLATHLPLRSYWRIPDFLRLTLAVQRQLAASEGLVGYSLLAEPMRKTFWTLSAWVDAGHLGAFTRALPHAEVMRQLRPHMGPTRFKTWKVPGTALPVSWADARAHLVSPTEAQREPR